MVAKSKDPKIPYHAFFNTDMELLQHGSTGDKKFVTSITLIPASRYLNNAIEEEATHLFIKERLPYDRDARYGIHHWPPKRALFYCSSRLQITPGNLTHDLKIVSIQFIAIDTMWGYEYLQKIIVKHLDEKEYGFSEADFHRLHVNDSEDMYLLKVQGKLCNLPKEMQWALITSLLIFTRSVIIRERVEDLQLGVESYQTKLNLTAPNLNDIPNIEKLS